MNPSVFPLPAGVDEVALGLTLDAYCHTGNALWNIDFQKMNGNCRLTNLKWPATLNEL